MEKNDPHIIRGSVEDIISKENKRFEVDYDNKRLKDLIENGGLS